MAFINERISDEDAKKYDPNDQFLTISRRWTIDREKEIFLSDGGMARMEPESKYMYIEYILFYVEYYFNSSVKPEDTLVVKKIKMPTHMQVNKEELFELMKKALSAYAGSGEVGLENTTNYIFDFNEVQ